MTHIVFLYLALYLLLVSGNGLHVLELLLHPLQPLQQRIVGVLELLGHLTNIQRDTSEAHNQEVHSLIGDKKKKKTPVAVTAGCRNKTSGNKNPRAYSPVT